MVPPPSLSRIVQRSNTFTARVIAARYGLAGPSSEQTKHSSQQPNASHLDVYNQDADPVRPHTRVFPRHATGVIHTNLSTLSRFFFHFIESSTSQKLFTALKVSYREPKLPTPPYPW